MSKNSRRSRKTDFSVDPIRDKPRKNTRGSGAPLKPLTNKQKEYMRAVDNSTITFSKGPAGTGKTYIAAAMAAEAFQRGEIETIIITRPAVEAEEEFGFLPGDLDEKFAPYFAPVRKILEERLGAGTVEYMLKAGQIEIAPIAFLRGHTFKDAWVLFDEAQNTTPKQMRLFLSRIGENCTVIIDGDIAQKDIQGPSGLNNAIDIMRGHPQVRVVEFTTDDIVRSGIAKDIIMRYDGYENDTEVGRDELNSIISEGANGR